MRPQAQREWDELMRRPFIPRGELPREKGARPFLRAPRNPRGFGRRTGKVRRDVRVRLPRVSLIPGLSRALALADLAAPLVLPTGEWDIDPNIADPGFSPWVRDDGPYTRPPGGWIGDFSVSWGLWHPQQWQLTGQSYEEGNRWPATASMSRSRSATTDRMIIYWCWSNGYVWRGNEHSSWSRQRQPSTGTFVTTFSPREIVKAFPNPDASPVHDANVARRLPAHRPGTPPDAVRAAPRPVTPSDHPEALKRWRWWSGGRGGPPGPHMRTPPPSRTRERKVRSRSLTVSLAMFKALDLTSEASEIVSSFYDALPKEVRKRWERGRGEDPDKYRNFDNFGQYGIDGADWKLQALYHNWDKVDLGEAFRNVAKNMVEDRVYGSIHRYMPKHAGGDATKEAWRAFSDAYREAEEALFGE
ncbi:MAG: hypothetical protein DI635_15460 [Pseudoxanthomonas suwonensis]|nr:MAG: hypothetical protein DI635_15460 [Pseudoxanthomonas suwonensis]